MRTKLSGGAAAAYLLFPIAAFLFAALLTLFSVPAQAATLYANVNNFAVEPIGSHGAISFLVPPPLSIPCPSCPSEQTSFHYLELDLPSMSKITVTIRDADGLRYLDAYEGRVAAAGSYAGQSIAFSPQVNALLFSPQPSNAWFVMGSQGIPVELSAERAFISPHQTYGIGTVTNFASVAETIQMDWIGDINAPMSGSFSVRRIDDFATPLPAALPLFAGGLGALGLFGWRRKQKAQAVAA